MQVKALASPLLALVVYLLPILKHIVSQYEVPAPKGEKIKSQLYK